jgi:hypothetical protein
VKIPVQEKIAELEGRIAKLEAWTRAIDNTFAQFRTTTTTTTSAPMTPTQEAALDRMWRHFNKTISSLREVFR